MKQVYSALLTSGVEYSWGLKISVRHQKAFINTIDYNTCKIRNTLKYFLWTELLSSLSILQKDFTSTSQT